MSSATTFKPLSETRPRRVTHRTRGRSHGPITRFVSPSDVGEIIKPFVFLDYFDIDPKHMPPIGFHPHSGIATLTLLHEGRIFYEETSGTKGIIEDTGFILGSAVKHPHNLVLGNYSVHTSKRALDKGEARIAEIGERLQNEGRL